MSERCEGCGALISLVGRVHRCSGHLTAKRLEKSAAEISRVKRWRAANRDHYNAYMRNKMREYRAKASAQV